MPYSSRGVFRDYKPSSGPSFQALEVTVIKRHKYSECRGRALTALSAARHRVSPPQQNPCRHLVSQLPPASCRARPRTTHGHAQNIIYSWCQGSCKVFTEAPVAISTGYLAALLHPWQVIMTSFWFVSNFQLVAHTALGQWWTSILSVISK